MNAIFVLFVAVTCHVLQTMGSQDKTVSVEFEVYGRVQGVFFRKHTQKQAKMLGLRGYCMNTEKGTVQGTMFGDRERVNEMKKWLQEVGSPSSNIERAVFSNERVTSFCKENDFIIKR